MELGTHFNIGRFLWMNLSKREQKKMVLNILESKLKEWRVSAKLMMADKNCDLQTYE